MKKLLTLALTALFGWGSASATDFGSPIVVLKGSVPPTTTLVDGGKYILYDAAKANGTAEDTRAIRRVASGATAITGYGSQTFPTTGEYLYNEVAFQAVAVKNANNEITGWQFKHLGTNKWIEARSANGDINVADQAGTYTATLNSDYSAFQVKCTDTDQSWDGQGSSYNYKMVSWWANGTDADTHFYRFMSLEDANMDVYDQAVTATFKTSESDTNPYTKTIYCTTTKAPELPGFTCSNPTMQPGVDLVYTLKEHQEFRLYNERNNSYMRVNGDGTNQTLGQIVNNNPAERTVFWKVPVNDNGGYIIYYPAGKVVMGPILGTRTTTALIEVTAPGQTYYDGKQAAPTDYMSWVGEVKATEENKSGTGVAYKFFNDLNSSGVCGYSWSDAGSKWVIVTNLNKFKENWALRQQLQAAIPNYNAALAIVGEEDTEGLAEWAQNYNFGGDVNVDVTPENMVKINKILNATIHADIIVTKRNANKLIALGGIKQSAVTAWNNAISTVGDNITADALSTLTAAYATLGKGFENIHINIQSGKTTNGTEDLTPAALVDYIGANLNNGTWEPKRFNGGVGTRAWTLEPVSETEANGFYLFNEYTNKYFKHPVATDHNGFLVDNKSEASVYMLDVYVAEDSYNDNKTKFGIKTLDENPVSGLVYLHSNGDNNIVPWNPCHPSSWYISQVSDEVAATEHLNGAVALAGAFDLAKVGTGIGYYSATNTEAYTSAKTAATAAQAEGSSATERNTAANALWAAYHTMNPTLITPTPGRYYRIKNKASGKYMHNIPADGRLPIGDNSDANAIKTIWVFDGTRLIAYPSGLALGTFAQGDTGNSWGAYNEGLDSAHSGTVTFDAGHTIGSLYVAASTGRYIEGSGGGTAGQVVNVGSGPNSDAYSWEFDAVNWLPVREHNGNPYKTFISSEELIVSNNRYGVYEVSVDEDGISYNKLSGNIPAGKPVLLIENGGSQINTANHHVYLEVNHAAAPATAVIANGALHGSFKAGLKAEGKKYYALNENFAYAEIAGEATEGFTAYIEPGEDAAEELAIVLPATQTKGESNVSLSNGSHKITLSHSSAIHPNPAVSEPLRINVKDDSEEPEAEETEMTGYRRVIASNDGEITINSTDFRHEYNAQGNALNAKEVHATLENALEQGEYTMSVPAGFLIADGATTPAHTYSFEVKSDGTTVGINEVMVGLQQGDVYDLQGRKLAAPVKGINIIGGRKVLVK